MSWMEVRAFKDGEDDPDVVNVFPKNSTVTVTEGILIIASEEEDEDAPGLKKGDAIGCIYNLDYYPFVEALVAGEDEDEGG